MNKKTASIKHFNVNFYKSEKVYEYTLAQIHSWEKNYKTLEYKHDYIQWLFPSTIPSAFNYSSYALTKQEAQIFREDLIIAKNMVESYRIMLDFYGIVIKDFTTGKLERGLNYKKRYKEAILDSSHNLLRISRIMCCLNCVGFRRYAIQLVEHFRKEIYEGEKPLQDLTYSRSFERFWVKFGIDHSERQQQQLQQNKMEQEDEEEQELNQFWNTLQSIVRIEKNDLETDSVYFQDKDESAWKLEKQQILQKCSEFYNKKLEQKQNEEKRKQSYHKQGEQQFQEKQNSSQNQNAQKDSEDKMQQENEQIQNIQGAEKKKQQQQKEQINDNEKDHNILKESQIQQKLEQQKQKQQEAESQKIQEIQSNEKIVNKNNDDNNSINQKEDNLQDQNKNDDNTIQKQKEENQEKQLQKSELLNNNEEGQQNQQNNNQEEKEEEKNSNGSQEENNKNNNKEAVKEENKNSE